MEIYIFPFELENKTLWQEFYAKTALTEIDFVNVNVRAYVI